MTGERTYINAAFEGALDCEDRCVLACAPAGSGKTELLARKALQLVARGVAPEEILFIAQSPYAADATRERLALMDLRLDGVSVVTPVELLNDIFAHLGKDKCKENCCRVLAPSEYALVLEDVRRKGVSHDILQSLLEKLEIGFGFCDPAGVSGLSPEEEQAWDLLKADLAFLQAILPQQAAQSALEACLADNCANWHARWHTVLLDDAHNTSTSFVRLANYLCSRQLIVCEDSRQRCCARYQGFSTVSLENTLPFTCFIWENSHENQSIGRFCDELLPQAPASGSMPYAEQPGNAREPEIIVVKWGEPQDETNGLARLVQQLINLQKEANPSQIAVVGPSSAWIGKFQASLNARRIKSQIVADEPFVHGDPLQLPLGGALAFYCLLAFAAHSEDPALWRLWLALDGGYSACDNWDAFQNWARTENLGVIEALHRVALCDDSPFPQAQNIKARYEKAQSLRAELQQRRSYALVRAAAAAAGIQTPAFIIDLMDGGEDASEAFSLVRQLAYESHARIDSGSVQLGTYHALQGRNFQYVILAALTECDFKDSLSANDEDQMRKAFCLLSSQAKNRLVLSSSQYMDLNEAKKQGAAYSRVRYRHGKKMAVLTPLRYIAQGSAALPGSMSGEQLLGSRILGGLSQ